MSNYAEQLRAYGESDLAPLARLLHAARAWPPTSGDDPRNLVTLWQRRSVRPDNDVLVLPGSGEVRIAMCQASIHIDNSTRLTFTLAVHPEFRRRGIGSSILERLLERGKSERASYLSTAVYSTESEPPGPGRDFLLKRGFLQHHSFWQMRIERIENLPQAAWPENIECRAFEHTEDDAKRWASLVQRAFNEPSTAAAVLTQAGEPGAFSGGYLFAVDRVTGQEVGTARTRIENVGGTQVGYVGTVGVLPRYRGRGIAAALVTVALQRIAAHGVSSATLFVEDSNANARRIYEKMGWTYTYRTDHFWKRVDLL